MVHTKHPISSHTPVLDFAKRQFSFVQMETGATASVPRDMGEEKDEPDFIETHCHWVDCDREMGCNDELVKVRPATPTGPQPDQIGPD